MQIITLLSGSIMAQVITFAFIPVITRLYTPEEFGFYSLFFSMTMAVGLISSLKYEQAILLPKSNTDARAILFLSLIILFVVVCISIITVFIFYDWFLNLFDNHSIYIYLLPVAIAVFGLGQIFESYSNRVEVYKQMSISKIISASGTVSLQIFSKYILNFNGLIFSKLFSDFLGILFLIKTHIKKETLTLKHISKRRIKTNLKRHEHFPKFLTASTLINYLSQNLPIFLFPLLFSSDIVGYYALAFRMLMVPTTLVSGSVRSVYYQKASKMFAKKEDIRGIYLKTMFGLLKIFIIPFFVVLLFGNEIFAILFGQEWQNAGMISRILVFTALFAFINPPSTMTFNILQLQKVQLYIQILHFFFKVLALFIGYYFFHSYLISIGLYVFVAVMFNVYSILFIDKKLKKLSTKK